MTSHRSRRSDVVRVHLIFLFRMLMGEGAQSTGEGGSFAVRDVFFLQLRNLALIRVHSHSFAANVPWP